MTYTLIPNIWYTITPETDCDLATPNGISIHLPAGIQYFHYADCVSIDITGTATVTQNPPLFKPASASALGGGYIESNLHIGHGASAAVAAQCTLTLGNLATGGTLEDSNGHHVELEDPHKYATGTVSIPDATAAGTLAIGEWSKTWEAKAAANATGYWPNEAGSYSRPPIELRKLADPENPEGEYEVLWNNTVGFNSAEAFIAAFNSEQDFAEAEEISEYEPFLITAKGDYAGEKGNSLVLHNPDGEYYVTQLEGGKTARTAADVFHDIHEDPDCPVDVTLDADEQGLGFTAKEYGVNDTISAVGDMFANWSGMSGGHGDYTIDELLLAIDGEFDDITPTAGETEGTIVLTADTPGAAANSITYTASGCFGSGTVKQDSTTRGKEAVAQTDFEIILNGNQPRPLTPTTVMKHGGVYTVAAAFEATSLSLPANATAEIWVRIGATAFNVQLPDSWVWVNGAASDMTGKTNTTFCIAVRNDGAKVLASMQYSYDTTPAQS